MDRAASEELPHEMLLVEMLLCRFGFLWTPTQRAQYGLMEEYT